MAVKKLSKGKKSSKKVLSRHKKTSKKMSGGKPRRSSGKSKSSKKHRKYSLKGGNPFKTNDAFLGNLNYEQECPNDAAKQILRNDFKKALVNPNHPCNVKLSNIANSAVRNPKTNQPYTVNDLPLELITKDEKAKMNECVRQVKEINDVPCGQHKSMTVCLGKNAGQRPDGSFGRFRGEPVRIKNSHLLGQTAIDLQDYDVNGNTKSYNYCSKYRQPVIDDKIAAEMSDPLNVIEGGVAIKKYAFDENAMERLRQQAKLRYYEGNKTNKYLVGGARSKRGSKRKSKRSHKSSRK